MPLVWMSQRAYYLDKIFLDNSFIFLGAPTPLQIAGPRGQTKTKICKSYQASFFGVWRWWGTKEEMSWDAFGDGRRPGLWFLVSAFTLAKSVEEPVYWYSSIPIYWYTHLSVYQYTGITIYRYTHLSVYQYTGIPGKPRSAKREPPGSGAGKTRNWSGSSRRPGQVSGWVFCQTSSATSSRI